MSEIHDDGMRQEEDTTSCDATMKNIRQLNINKCLTLDILFFLSDSLSLMRAVFSIHIHTHNVAERSYISLEVISLLRFLCLTFNFYFILTLYYYYFYFTLPFVLCVFLEGTSRHTTNSLQEYCACIQNLGACSW